MAAGAYSFAAGLLEAMTQCAADLRPVLLVGCDTDAVGPLRSVNTSRGLLAVALVLVPPDRSGRALTARLLPCSAPAPALRSAAARTLQSNAMGDALPLFEALAEPAATSLALPLSATLSLALDLAAA